MKLLTKAIEQKLDKNWPDEQGLAVPALKIFNPYGVGTWLITRRDPKEPDYLWGLCDLGFPETGPVLLSELQSIKCPPFGLGLERDLYFKGQYPVSVYEQAARIAGRITLDHAYLEAAANSAQ